MTFLRLFAGFLLQVIPFAVLAFYPYREHLRCLDSLADSNTCYVFCQRRLHLAASISARPYPISSSQCSLYSVSDSLPSLVSVFGYGNLAEKAVYFFLCAHLRIGD